MKRAVKRGLLRREAQRVSEIGVAEKAFRKGHSYFTLANDLVKRRVPYVVEGRAGDPGWILGDLDEAASAKHRSGDHGHVDPYVVSVRQHVPEGGKKIVFDELHIAEHLGEAVDRTRAGRLRSCFNQLQREVNARVAAGKISDQKLTHLHQVLGFKISSAALAWSGETTPGRRTLPRSNVHAAGCAIASRAGFGHRFAATRTPRRRTPEPGSSLLARPKADVVPAQSQRTLAS